MLLVVRPQLAGAVLRRHVSRTLLRSWFMIVSVRSCTLWTSRTWSATLFINAYSVSASACQLQVWPASFQPYVKATAFLPLVWWFRLGRCLY